MIVPPPPKRGSSAVDYGRDDRIHQLFRFRKWYRDRHTPYGMMTDPRSRWYIPGNKRSSEAYWRKKDPMAFAQFREELEDAVKRYVSDGSYPGYPHYFIY